MNRMLSIVLALLLAMGLPAGVAAQAAADAGEAAVYAPRQQKDADPLQPGEDGPDRGKNGAEARQRGKAPDPSRPQTEKDDPAADGGAPADPTKEADGLSADGRQAASPAVLPAMALLWADEESVDSIGSAMFAPGPDGILHVIEPGAAYYGRSVYFPLLTASGEHVKTYEAVSQAEVSVFPQVAHPDFTAKIAKKKYAQQVDLSYSYFVELDLDPGTESVEIAATLSVTKETGEVGYQFSVERDIEVALRYPRVQAQTQGERLVIQPYPQVFDVSSAGGSVVFEAGESGAVFEIDDPDQPAIVLQFADSFQSGIADLYPYADLHFYNFRDARFARAGRLRIPAGPGGYLYRLADPSTGELEPLGQGSYSYEGGEFVIPTDALCLLVVSDTELTWSELPENPQSIACIGGDYYAADDQGVVRASTQNTTGLTGDDPIYIPLYDGEDRPIAQSWAVKNVTTYGVFGADEYAYDLRIAAMPTDLAGDVQEAYFVELRSMDDGRPIRNTRTPFLQDTFEVEIFVEGTASGPGQSYFELLREITLTAGYPVAPFAVTQTAQPFDVRGLSGQYAILLDAAGVGALILADLTDIDGVTLAYDKTAQPIDAGDLPGDLRFHNITVDLEGEGARPALYVEGRWGDYVYRLEGAAPIWLGYTDIAHRGLLCVQGEAADVLRMVISPRILVAEAEPAPGRVAAIENNYHYLADRQGVVREELRLSSGTTIAPGQALYLPLLTAEEGPVLQPEAVSDIEIELSYELGHDAVESVSVVRKASDLFSSGGATAESYFIEVVMRQDGGETTATADAIWIVWMKKHSPPGYGFGLQRKFAIGVGYPQAHNWEITGQAQVFDFTGQTELSLTFKEISGLTFAVNVVGQSRLVLQADAQPDTVVRERFSSAALTFVNANGANFNKPGDLRFPASCGDYHYRLDSDGGLTRLTTTRSGQIYTLRTRTLERYVISDRDLFPPPPSDDGDGGGDSGGGSGGGGGGGGGSRSSGGGSPASAQPSLPATQPLTSAQALSALDAALAKARAANTPTAAVRILNKDLLPLEVAQELLQKGRSAGIAAVIHADYVVNNAVAVRFYIDPSRLTKAISVAARLDDAAVNPARTVFTRFFENKMAFIRLGQIGDYGTPVAMAARVDLTGMDAAGLHFYNYDAATNRYTAITAPNYRVDTAGFLHFTTSQGGYIVISQGPLVRRG
jgi:hypothetical protein